MFLLSVAWFSYGNYRAGSEPWQIVVSALLLSIPLLLLYFSIGVLAFAARQRRVQGAIDRRLAKYIYWTPRIAGALIALFVALFALDVFEEGGNFWLMIGGFLIHALPAILLGVALAFAWRWSWIGAVVYLAGALYFLRFLLGNPFQELGLLLLFSGPMAVIAALFWVNWQWRKELRRS
jgi:hypothetical protein